MSATSLRDIAILSVLLCGCASTYTLSNESLSIRSTLDEGNARQIIGDALKQGPEGRGGAYMAAGARGKQHWALDSRLNGATIEWLIAYIPTSRTLPINS